MKPYVFILGLSAILIAGAAAFFSVSGIAALFTGAFWAIVIMAGSLEFGKLVAASFLHRYWHETSLFLKSYLSIGVFVLMVITSMGIFGFLTGAYQEQAAQLDSQNAEISTLESRKSLIEDQIENYRQQRQELTQLRSQQASRLDSLYSKEWYNSARRTEDRIDDLSERQEALSANISTRVDSVAAIESQILEIESNSEASRELGPLLYVAREFNTDIDTAVKYFTLLLIFVFDPMAVSLIIAYNVALEREQREDQSDDETGPSPIKSGGDDSPTTDPSQHVSGGEGSNEKDKNADLSDDTESHMENDIKNEKMSESDIESQSFSRPPMEAQSIYGEDQIEDILEEVPDDQNDSSPNSTTTSTTNDSSDQDVTEEIMREVSDENNENTNEESTDKQRGTKRVDFHNGKRTY